VTTNPIAPITQTAQSREAAAATTPLGPWRRRLLYALHAFIIINFLIEIVYASAVVFIALKPEGIDGPLFGAAATLPFELVAKRRMYAQEMWTAMAGLCIYLALTEIGPRLKRHRGF
jgi:hypothetical protein